MTRSSFPEEQIVRAQKNVEADAKKTKKPYVGSMRAWPIWAVTFLCACSAAVPALPVGQPRVLVIHPGGYKPIDLTPEELQQGMRMLYANGPLPGLPKRGKAQFILASANAFEMQRAVGYLEHCQRITGKRIDCWDDLNASGGLDDEGATYVALHFALGEALDTAAVAVGSMTPTQVRAMMSLMFLGMIVELLAPEPVTKVLFVVSATSLIACVGVDIFNNVVKGFTAMLEDLGRAQDFAAVRGAGVRYGQRIGPTVGRIVVMVATYGLAKFAGLFKGSLRDLPGGSRAAALADAQGFKLSEVEGARSIALGADGSVVIEFGGTAAMAVAYPGPKSGAEARHAKRVLILDQDGRPCGEFDEVQPGRVIEDKSAKGIEVPNPKTGRPQQTVKEWARDQIYKGIKTRLDNLRMRAQRTAPSPGQPPEVPSLSELRSIREYLVRVENSSPEVQAAVREQLAELSKLFPEWKFSATFGPP